MDTFASGNFKGEQEITTLMGQRFMLLKAEKTKNIGGTGKNGLEIHVLLLPPDPNYVADLEAKAAATPFRKAMMVFFTLRKAAA
ncbi:protein of unknown function [Candidatus Methylocalor cossyra]|uniref:Uncharacterized protein n=1 Tax=Candidatus Methylocalor cossyra TaxID=3108543 RepID=A0ABP1C915_9GAMM